MHRKIAAALLESVFYRVSAVVSLDGHGGILGVALFSTDWPQGHMRISENAEEVWLISHHPDGGTLPDERDESNLRLLVSMAGGAKVRLFLSSEYYPCFEWMMIKTHKHKDCQEIS